MILLTVSVEADRTGKRYGEKIPPDEVVEAARNTPDPQIAAAVRWLPRAAELVSSLLPIRRGNARKLSLNRARVTASQ